MKSIRLKAYAKVNLSLDVLGKLDNGYHQVEMIMQQIKLSDDVFIRWFPDEDADGISITLKTNRYYLPVDSRNLAYKAAQIMSERVGHGLKGTVRIDIKKNIPVAAGLAGGSGNGAAVLHGLNVLWEAGLNLEKLCSLGAELGSDVPFTIMGQARGNRDLIKVFGKDPMATTCALAYGTGTELKPIKPLESPILLSKPPLSVSTAEVYQGLDKEAIEKRPDNKAMEEGLMDGNIDIVKKNMVNVLEGYTLSHYKQVKETKEKMIEVCPGASVLMSGSGPSVFAVSQDREELERGYKELKEINEETYLTRTIV